MAQKPGFLKRSTETKEKEKYLLLFIVAYVGMLLAFIPTMITNDGIFLYYGDFNSQQVMFYEHANEMVRNGNMGWDWGTDLGANFIGSYSFYLLGSPFFWLSTLLPLKTVPFILPWLLSLKTAVAAITSYAYIRRFVENKNACFAGAMLYAFSGFQAYNVFFNHFHDVTAFFPLLLLGLEMLVQDKKKGAFALAVGICAAISYFFFACEVVFLVIYFFIRCTDKEFKIDIKTFGLIAFESILGVMLSAIIFLPACIDVLLNPRLAERLYGLDMVFYNENVRIPRIIQAFFMMSDMPARINILHTDKANWASIAGYLPMFSMCGVIAFMRTVKKNWASKLIIVCGIMACIPILNSSFVLFNSSYYARWFYMPILIMCLMTAKMIGDYKGELKKGFIPTAIVAGFFLIAGILPTREGEDLVVGKVPEHWDLYLIQAAVTVILTAILSVVIYIVIEYKQFYRVVAITTSFACIATMITAVCYGSAQGEYNHFNYIKYGIYGKENLDMDKLNAHYEGDNNFYRIDTSPDVDNWCMFWGLSSMRTFHSVVPTSILDFYHSINQTRDVASRMETTMYPLRGLLSVRYYFDKVEDSAIGHSDTMTNLVDFKYVDTQNNFNIYENEHWIPMGFAYDMYTTDGAMKSVGDVDKANMLLEAMVLDNYQILKYSDVITRYDHEDYVRDQQSYKAACADRRNDSCYYFKEDTDGFDAKINLAKDKLVFFSVPYDDGWTATVNGEEVDVERVSYGFMAVLCEEGENVIRFNYKTVGLTAGKIITASGVVIFIAYVGGTYYYNKKKKTEEEARALKNAAVRKKK